jgi:ribosomal protein L11 methyltransferase
MIRLGVRVRREHAELVLAELLELAPAGVEEREDGDVVEYAVYGAPGELPELPDLHAAAGGALVEVTTTEVADDWDERWKAFHRPVQVGGLLVRPPWEPPRDGLRDIVIDPAQAFGTGAHPTTRLCLELLLELDRGSLLDVGCGSGVLAIAGARLGFAPVSALDHDGPAVEATRRNAHANGVSLDVVLGDALDEPLPPADVVVANLSLTAIERLAPRLSGRVLVSAGYLAAERPRVEPYHSVERRVAGRWAADLCVRS